MGLKALAVRATNVHIGFARALGILPYISTKFEQGIQLGAKTVDVDVVKPGVAKRFSSAYELTNANTSTVPITMSEPIYVPTKWSSLEHSSSGYQTARLAMKYQADGYNLGVEVFKEMEAKWAGISSLKKTDAVAAETFDTSDIINLRKIVVGLQGGVEYWTVVLSDEAYASLLDANKIVSDTGDGTIRATGELKNMFGLNIVSAPISTAGTTGFLVSAGSTGFASQVVVPAFEDVANKVEAREVIPDPSGSGLALQRKRWFDSVSDSAAEILQVWQGSAVVDAGGIYQIPSA